MAKSESKRKEIVVGIDNINSVNYIEFLKKKFDVTKVIPFTELSEKGTSVDLLVFTGGADVDPSYYGENQGKYTRISEKRDRLEIGIATHFLYSETPKLGICRGSQLLTVANGGKLIQHVTNHGSNHDISVSLAYVKLKEEHYQNNMIDEIENSLTLTMTSTHHQMMYPFGLDEKEYELIGWSSYFLSDTYLDGDNNEKNLKSGFLEPEIVYYNRKNSLCIQGHPEYANCSNETSKMCLDLIETKLFKKKKDV